MAVEEKGELGIREMEITQDEKTVAHDGPSHDAGDLLSSNEKPLTEQTEATALDGNSPILSLYLTFDTILPSPPTLQQPSLDGREPPPCPDLTAYADPLTWGPARKSILLTCYSCGHHDVLHGIRSCTNGSCAAV
jgi:hypothetical protein